MGRWFFSDVILTLEKIFCDDPERGWWSWQMPQINHKVYLGRSGLQKLSGCWHYTRGLNHVTMMKHLQLTLSWQRLPSAKCLLAQVRISPDSNSPLGVTTKGKLLTLTSENSCHVGLLFFKKWWFKTITEQSDWAGQPRTVLPPGWSEPHRTMRKRDHRYFKPSFMTSWWPESWKSLEYLRPH